MMNLSHTPGQSNSFNTDGSRVSRFKREAEALAQINHPNVVMVIDFGIVAEEIPYIAMEYIDGIMLRQLLAEQETLSERQAIQITKQICAGLHEAHHRG